MCFQNKMVGQPQNGHLFQKGETGKKEGVTGSKVVQNLAGQIPLDSKAGKESSLVSYSALQDSRVIIITQTALGGGFTPKALQGSTSPKTSSF